MIDFVEELRLEIYKKNKVHFLKELNKLEYEFIINKINEEQLFYCCNDLKKRLYHKVSKLKKSPDYVLKSKCLKTGQYMVVKKMNNILFKFEMGEIDSLELNNEYEELNKMLDLNLYNECQKMIKADYQKRKRLKNRITEILSSGKCYFVTLTFNDQSLELLPHIRRKYVQQWLKENSINYVGNIDFGKKNGREHYHAIVRADYLINFTWNYGFMDFEEINHYSSNEKLTSYILKLTNHALKETTKRYALLYPKKKKCY